MSSARAPRWTLSAVRAASRDAVRDIYAEDVTASTRGLVGDDAFTIRAGSYKCIESIVAALESQFAVEAVRRIQFGKLQLSVCCEGSRWDSRFAVTFCGVEEGHYE